MLADRTLQDDGALAVALVVVYPGYSSRLIAEGTFFCKLCNAVPRLLGQFLGRHARDVGEQSPSDLGALLETA